MRAKVKMTICCAIILTMGIVPAFAHEAGDIMVRVGAATVVPNVDSGAVSGLPDGVNNATVDVDNNTQLGLTVAYLVTDNIGVELLAATPFSHSLSGDGDIDGVEVGKTHHLPPTLTLQYYLGDNSWPVNPYVGVGVNYTVFFDEEVDQNLIDTLNTLPTIASLGGISSVDIELDSSFGLAGVIGCDVKLTDQWFLNAAAWYIDLNTTATLKTDLGTEHKVDVDLDPWAFMVAVAYRF
jgi:outer membrane protein